MAESIARHAVSPARVGVARAVKPDSGDDQRQSSYLDEAGDLVILGYHAQLNPRALGFQLAAVIRAKPGPGQLHQVGDLARKTPEVVGCRRITGEDCYIMTVHVRSVEHLEEVIDRFCRPRADDNVDRPIGTRPVPRHRP